MSKPKTIHTIESLHARCVEEGDCWLWQGFSANDVPMVYRDGKMVPVRKVLAQLHGVEVRDGVYLVPKCEDKRCVCHEHTVQRPAQSHMKAMGKRASSGTVKTERIRKSTTAARTRRAKLDAGKAMEIRMSDESSSALAERFGVHRSLVARVRAGTKWKDYSSPFAGLFTGLSANDSSRRRAA